MQNKKISYLTPINNNLSKNKENIIQLINDFNAIYDKAVFIDCSTTKQKVISILSENLKNNIKELL